MTLARVAVATRNRAFSEADRESGDTNWGLACKAHERLMHALERLAGEHPWLRVVREGLYVMPLVEDVPVRLYRGAPDRPGSRHLDAVRFEYERSRSGLPQMAFDFMVGPADGGPWYWLMAMETDAAGMVSRVIFVQANDAGEDAAPLGVPARGARRAGADPSSHRATGHRPSWRTPESVLRPAYRRRGAAQEGEARGQGGRARGRAGRRRPARRALGRRARGGVMEGPSFIGPKLKIARTFQGLGQAELGERLGIGRTLVGQLEAGARSPAPELCAKLTTELGFGAVFFATPLADELRDEECHGLRGQPHRRRALAHASLLAELVAWLDDRVRLPEENLPDDLAAGDPEATEAAAAACRSRWGLAPDLPIPNLTRVVERAGVVVVRGHDAGAFARVGRRLLVVLDAAPLPGDARFELARLAGHAVLHRGADARGRARGRGPPLRERAAPAARRAPARAAARALARLDGPGAAGAAVEGEPGHAGAARRRDARGQRGALPGRGRSLRRPRRAERSIETPDEMPEVMALALERLEQGLRIRRTEVARRLGWSPQTFASVTGLDAGHDGGSRTRPSGEGRGDNVVSLAAWKARRSSAPPSPAPLRSTSGGAQLELDFNRPV